VFRPNRDAHQALKKTQEYVERGRNIVVDIDVEKFFDTVNHDVHMGKLAKPLGDKRVLCIIRKFLQSGIIHDGVCIRNKKWLPSRRGSD